MEESFGLQDYSEPGDAVQSVDPVCGKTVDESKAAGKIGYKGAMYYFCSTDCLHRFQEYPDRYYDVVSGQAGPNV